MYRGRLIPGDDLGVSISHNSDHSSLVVDKRASLSHRTKRIACVLVADFAVAAITRANPELRDRPFAIIRIPTAHLADSFPFDSAQGFGRHRPASAHRLRYAPPSGSSMGNSSGLARKPA